MFKLIVAVLAVLGLAAAKPSFYSVSPVAYSAYSSPVVYSSASYNPVAYSSPLTYSAPLAYSAYISPLAYASTYPAYYWKK